MGGAVAGIEVSTDGGTTWHRANGRGTWSYTWNVSGVGTVNIRSRAVDDSGNLETPSGGITVTVPAPTFVTIFSSGATPSTPDAGADSPVELGVKFKADSNGTIIGIRFYKSNLTRYSRRQSVVKLRYLARDWHVYSRNCIGVAATEFLNADCGVGHTVYVASYHTNGGHYSADQNYFKNAGFDNPPLHALQDGISGANGVFAYGANSTFPSSGFNSSNYWVDVAFTPSATLNSITVTPANPAIASGSTQQFVATGTFSDNSTQNISSQVTWSSSNSGVATINSTGLATGVAGGSSTIKATQGSVNGSTTLTVQPTALSITTASLPAGTVGQAYSNALAASGGTAPYTWTVSSGTLPTGLTLTSAGQISGTPSAAATFTFTVQVADGGAPQQIASKQLSITVAAAPTTRTIWTSTTVPGTVDAGADSAVELGVKFKSDVNGSIVGIRFYKASTNLGTHVANLWTSTGTLLATATFTSETASGWQQVNFANPVAITANTVYVASYHSTGGHYSVDQNFFTTAGVDNVPLHALQSGVSGANGVYAYGSSSSFPSNDTVF